MNKGLKIFVWVVAILGLLSLIFLMTSKKKPTVTTARPSQKTATKVANPQPVQAAPKVEAQVPAQTSAQAQAAADARKKLIRDQWTLCKAKTLASNTNLFWNIQISEAIPQGGTYAKGNLDNDPAYPVHVIIKSDAQNPDQIKARLAVGKVAFVRGTCTDVATDGSVVLQAF